jgi:hypothetical protein
MNGKLIKNHICFVTYKLKDPPLSSGTNRWHNFAIEYTDKKNADDKCMVFVFKILKGTISRDGFDFDEMYGYF